MPTKIENLPPIYSASAGDCHTILIAEDGTAYGHGWNCYGQLSFDSSLQDVLVPTKIKIGETESGIKAAYCSRCSSILQDASLRSTPTIISGHLVKTNV